MKLGKIISLTALALGTALGGCKEPEDAKDLSNKIVGLKAEFILACENKIGQYELHDGKLDLIIERRNRLLSESSSYSVENEYWWCGNDGGFYRPSFPQTQFPHPTKYQIRQVFVTRQLQ